MEVQAHGNYFEDIKTREITGMSKDEYDNLKDKVTHHQWILLKDFIQIET